MSAANSSHSRAQHHYEAPPFEPSRRNHALPPRPALSVDSYRPSYDDGSNGRSFNSHDGGHNFSSYTAPQLGYSQGGNSQRDCDQGRQREAPDWYIARQRSQQSHSQPEQTYGRNQQSMSYSEWWDKPTGQFGGRGHGYGPLDGGGVAVSRNDRYDRYDNHGNRDQSIPSAPRNDFRNARNDYESYSNNDSRISLRDDGREVGSPWESREQKRRAKKNRKRTEKAAQQPPQGPPQQGQPPVKKSKGKSVLPVPIPTEDYLALTESHLPDDPDYKKLLVLDLNDALVHRTAPNGSGKRTVRPRPFLTQFLNYIFAHFTVMVWSSARPHNVTDMVTGSFSSQHQKSLVAIWSRENFGLKPEHYNAKIITYKNLEMVWDKIQHPEAEEGRRWDQTNTVLIDDSIEKACAQPHNHLLIDVWDNPQKQAGDRTLLDVIGYLEKVVRPTGNVSEAMRECTFEPGTGKWEEFIPTEVVKEEEVEGEIPLEEEETEEVEAIKSAVEDEVEEVETRDEAMVEEEVRSESDDDDQGGVKLKSCD